MTFIRQLAADGNILVNYQDVELDIYYTYSPSRPAFRDPGGNIIDPAEYASVELSGIYIQNKTEDTFDLLCNFDLDELGQIVLEAVIQRNNEISQEGEEYENCEG
jgi:hypothetical protein